MLVAHILLKMGKNIRCRLKIYADRHDWQILILIHEKKDGAKRIKIGYDKNTDKLMRKNREIVQGFFEELFHYSFN